MRNAWLCGVAMLSIWTILGISPTSADGAFLVITPGSGLSRAVTNGASPSPVTTYTPIAGTFLIGFDGRIASSTDATLGFALPVLSPGESIVSASIRVVTGFGTPSVGSTLTFRGTLSGDPDPASATPADFALPALSTFQGVYTVGTPAPVTYDFDVASTIFALASSPGLGVRLESITSGGINIQSVSLVIETRAVPEPSSLALAGLGGVGVVVVGFRRRRLIG